MNHHRLRERAWLLAADLIYPMVRGFDGAAFRLWLWMLARASGAAHEGYVCEPGPDPWDAP